MSPPPDFHEHPECYFKVRSAACPECLFSAGRLVDAETRARIVNDCLNAEIPHPLDESLTTTGRFFMCHQHTWKVPEGWDDPLGDELPPSLVVCCRRFYDLYGGQLLTIRLAQVWGGVVFVDPDGNPVEGPTDE